MRKILVGLGLLIVIGILCPGAYAFEGSVPKESVQQEEIVVYTLNPICWLFTCLRRLDPEYQYNYPYKITILPWDRIPWDRIIKRITGTFR